MPTETALLLIDVQIGLLAGDRPVYQAAAVLARIAALAARARAPPVLYAQDKDVPDEVSSPGWQIHPDVAPAPGDLVVRKA